MILVLFTLAKLKPTRVNDLSVGGMEVMKAYVSTPAKDTSKFSTQNKIAILVKGNVSYCRRSVAKGWERDGWGVGAKQRITKDLRLDRYYLLSAYNIHITYTTSTTSKNRPKTRAAPDKDVNFCEISSWWPIFFLDHFLVLIRDNYFSQYPQFFEGSRKQDVWNPRSRTLL